MTYDRWSTDKFSQKRGTKLADDLDILRDDLCRHWGFCNWLASEDLLDKFGAITAEKFADELLRAEGVEPSYKPDFQRAIQRALTERYGASEISNELYSNSTIT